MCLYSWKSKIKAKTDIECYKVLKYDKNGILSSFSQDWFKWEIGKEYKADRAKFIYKNEIGNGYFHSYDSYKSSKSSLYDSVSKKYVICKCIIPKGTYFYQGIHSDGHEGYASKSIKIVEIL